MPTYYGAMYTGRQEEQVEMMTPPRSSESGAERMSGPGSGRGKGIGGVGGNAAAEHFDIGSERGSHGSWSGSSQNDWGWDSNASWWTSRSQGRENWTWSDPSSGWSSRNGNYYANWEWVKPVDPWLDWHREGRGDPAGVSHQHDQGVPRNVDHSQGRGDEPGSPVSPPAARDVSGALPSGEVSSAGQSKEHKVAGDQKHSKISSSYPPVFRAKPGESFKEWKRSVGFWLGGEAGSLPPELIGPRLMVQLRDRAGQLVHHLTNDDVNKPGGMEVVMQTLERSPLIRQLDKHKIDLHRKRLMSLKRLPQESIESYVTRGQLYRTQLVALDDAMQMGECFFTGHLLDGARLTRKDKIMIKTKAGSDLEVDVTNAMVELAPELEGEHGFPIGSSEPNVAARQGEEFLVQRAENSSGRFVKKEVNAVEFESPFQEEMQDVDDESSVLYDEHDPPELVQAAHEAFALQHKAKQRIMEVRKLRQYYRRPEPEDRRRAIQEKMKTSPCHRCGEYGHWSRECPQKPNAAAVSSPKPGAGVKASAEDDWATLVSLCHQQSTGQLSSSSQYKERFIGVVNQMGQTLHETLWCQKELRLNVILDLGCVKSVVGVDWMNNLLGEWKSKSRWFRIQPESEQFQFGNGESLTSRFRVEFECMVAGCHMVIGMSVVNGNCPPLLSRHACTQMGMRIDCGGHSFSSTRMGIKTFGLLQASNGHYLMPISNFDVNRWMDVPKDFQLEVGQEVHILQKACTELTSTSSTPAAVMFEKSIDCSPCDIAPSVPHGAVHGHGLGGEQSGAQAAGRGEEADGMRHMRRSRSPCPRMPNAGRDGGGRGGSADGRGRGLQGGDTEGSSGTSPRLSPCTPTEDLRAHRDAFDYGLGASAGSDGRGGQDHQQAQDPRSSDQVEERDDQGSHRRGCRLSQPLARVVGGGGDEHGFLHGRTDASVSVEETPMAIASESSCREDDRSQVEEKSTLASNAAVQGSCGSMGSLWSSSATPEREGHSPPDVTRERQLQLQRGMTQKLKNGVRKGLATNRQLTDVALMEERYVVLEIFAGAANLTKVANMEKMRDWRALPPVDILFGHDLTKKATRDEVWKIIYDEEPDLITLSMPCGPWCQWMNLCDPDEVDAKRTADMPLWRFARDIWDYQTARGRLAMTENPLGSEGLKLTFMEERPSLWRAKVAQCMFGLCDVVSGKPHRKLTALDANDEAFSAYLLEGSWCTHMPGEHQILEGQVQFEGKWVNRTALASIWPTKLCRHILKAAQSTLSQVLPLPLWGLSDEVLEPKRWEGPETFAVSSGQIPEENMRHELQKLGAGGDRYGYITFEGEGQQAPRRIRSAVAHLHASLGHLANDRLVRMLMLSGAGEVILKAARNLRCQVCAMVQPPRDAPQVSYNRPNNFNERISGDTFFIWDSKNKKYGVVHFLDELTDFHVADCSSNPDSTFAAGVLRDQWYGIFGPPEVLLTDGGMEFAGAVEVLNDLMGVIHDTIPEGAKWRLGHAERHGGILKLMLLKMLKGMNLDGLDDVRMAVTAACTAKNRLCNHGGISPLQAVTGRNSVIPASLMTQICSGRMKFVLNQDLDREECLRRAERIRHAAIESFHWLDSHQTLRRALASKSRPPRLEFLKEGATVYIYDPPANRRGLARRLQDNISWHGPGTVVCVERDKRLPSRVWVRLRGRVKAVPLEKIRLATDEELISGQFIQEALKDVQEELTSGRLRATEVDASPLPLEDAEQPVPSELIPVPEETMSSDSDKADDEDEDMQGDRQTERMRLEKRLLDDVPLQMRHSPQPSSGARGAQDQESEEPHTMPFPKKQKMFEKLAKQLEPPTRLQEARVRSQLENAYDQLKTLRKTMRTSRPRPKATARDVVQRRTAMGIDVPAVFTVDEPAPEMTPMFEQTSIHSEKVETLDPWTMRWSNDVDVASPSPAGSSSPTTEAEAAKPSPIFRDDVGMLEKENLVLYLNRKLTADEEDLELEHVINNIESGHATYGCHVTEVLQQYVLWTGDSAAAGKEMPDGLQAELQKEQEMLDQSNLITGKERVEIAWHKLDDKWKEAFVEPIIKSFKVYFQHQALAGVPEGQWIDPKRILPSRLVLTNKGGNELSEAELKARWVFGGHRDPDAGKYPTSSPTVSLIGHNLLNFIAVQKGWIVFYEDVSAAFLQGQQLPSEREIYVKIPQGYPDEAMRELEKLIGPGMRADLVRLLKGGFGLPESPRLWYLEYRQTLLDLGGRELWLLPGFFVFDDEEGNLIGLACIHVDDTRYTGSPAADRIWKALHERLNFGKKRSGCDGWVKFCGRYERQDPVTKEIFYSMDEYCRTIPCVQERGADDMIRELTPLERKAISSVIGQLAWAARQCRPDLCYGCSHVQQLAGQQCPTALKWLNKVVKRAKLLSEMPVRRLDCSLEEVVFLAISDAAYAAQPGGGSQGGLMVAIAHPNIQFEPSKLVILESQSSRLQRVVRCSMSAELSMAATAFEHGDYLRAVYSEILRPQFRLCKWKMFASQWKHILVLDAKVAYDALKSETAPTDRKLIVDIAVLRQALEDEAESGYVRWVPGKEIPTDGLTKWYANGSLEKIMGDGMWSLMDNETAAELRRRVAERKRSSSLTSSSSSSSSSTSGTTTSMTTSTHTATLTSSLTATSSTVSTTSSTSVTVTSSTTETVTSSSRTLSSTTSVSQTATSTSVTQTSSTQTRIGPPVQILSQPEDVQTIDSTLLVLGVNDTTPGLEESLQDSISSTVGVDPRRVEIADLGMTMAAVLDDGLRRLSMMELALEVNFQVILPGEGSFESSELGTFSSAASVLSAVSAIKDNPADLVSKLSAALPVETALRARLTTPTLQQKQAVMVAEEWGACGAGLTCARSEDILLRYRSVWCADAENISAKLSSTMCSGNTPRLMEPCPETVMHPPSCGWHSGAWSECRSQVLDDNGTDVLDNTTMPCNSSGIGVQQRQVTCLARDPAIDCDDPPARERECQCVASLNQLQLAALEPEPMLVETESSLIPLLIGVVAGGCMACTCCTFCCFNMLRGNVKSPVKKVEKSTLQFDGPAAHKPKRDADLHENFENPNRKAVTVCVAAGRRPREDRHEDHEGRAGEEWQAEDDEPVVACSVQSPLPSPHAPSYHSRITPLASPCSIASVSSQPRLPLPSPSAMSVSSISAVLQSPHSMPGSASELMDSLELQSPSRRAGPSSPKKKGGGPSLPALSEHQSVQGDQSEQTALFAALSSPSNFLRPASPSKRRSSPLPAVAEMERQAEVLSPSLPIQAHSDSEESNSGMRKPRKKKGPRPPTLELDRYLAEDEAPRNDEDVEVNYATSPSKSPSKRTASHAFAPAWLKDESETCGSGTGGTPSHAPRFELKSVPTQPHLPQPPTPGGTQPPPPIPKNPEPPSQPPQGLRRGNSKVNFPSVPPSPSAKNQAPIAQEMSDLALPSAPNLPPPPRLVSRESEGPFSL
eukprot:s9_g37.t1